MQHRCFFSYGPEPVLTYTLHDARFSGLYTASLNVGGQCFVGELLSLGFCGLETCYYPRNKENRPLPRYYSHMTIPSSRHGFSLLEPPVLPQWVVDAVAGFGDSLSFGLTDWIREHMGTDGVVNHHSDSYLSADIIGNALPLVAGVKVAKQSYILTRAAIAGGHEYHLGKDIRIAPFGNRTGDSIGKWPHYHRQGKIVLKGRGRNRHLAPRDGQSSRRHRPWQKHKNDKSFWDRF